jgi:gamma-glutamyltranspeptidase/glutathione hydrolase
MSGIGGVGAGLVYDAKSGRVDVIDFGGRSPAALDPADFPIIAGADRDLFGWPAVKDNRNTVGPRAVVAPTEPAGLALMHRRYGRLRWRDLLQPAIRLAEDGPVVDWHTELVIASALGDLTRDAGSRARFLRGGVPPQPSAPQSGGQPVRLPMPDLARTLGALATEGAEVLYRGPLGAAIAEDVRAMGGYLSTDDLAAVAPRIVDPLVIRYRDHSINVTPELSGGPTLAVAYGDLVARRAAIGASPDAAAFSDYAAALRAGWRHRFDVMGDAGERTAPTSTTHFAVVDRDGNIVTLTQTLLSIFGARIVLPKTGILMNNGINWFDPRPGGPNSIAPGRRVLANYAPAIMAGAQGVTGIGGCGGRRILPAVFQLLAFQAEYGFDLDRAFHTPRIDVSGLGPVVADRRLDGPVIDKLGRDFDVVIGEPSVLSNPFTVASAVARRDGFNEGATEPEHPWSEPVPEYLSDA